MSARVIVTAILENDVFAQYEAVLISDDPITASASGEGKAEISKTAKKRDIVYLNTEATRDFKPQINGEYHFHFVQSLYAKNNLKPIILNTTIIL